jgi:hypothetical protein
MQEVCEQVMKSNQIRVHTSKYRSLNHTWYYKLNDYLDLYTVATETTPGQKKNQTRPHYIYIIISLLYL